jgi:predicted  nucleic acid-binding Zn-ribbon protein
MFKPSKRSKMISSFNTNTKDNYTIQNSSNSNEDNISTINYKIFNIQCKILKLHNDVNKLESELSNKLETIITNITNINKTQKCIKKDISAIKEMLGPSLSNINNNIEHLTTCCDILIQNQQHMAEILFNGDNTMITIPDNNNSGYNYYS